MPLVAYKDLPAFERLREEGYPILPKGKALSQDIREMHIGLLNIMPDKALTATERQFFRLIGESSRVAQIYVHPFSLPELERSNEARDYIREHYETFDEIRAQGLDALIVTGANVIDPDLTKAPFWEPLQEVMDWAWDHVTSTLCSCLATHAVLEFRYGQKRQYLGEKLWGVYPHRVTDRNYPLVKGMNTVFDVPHSRFNTITRAQFEAAGMKVLVASEQADVHMAVSPDGFRLVCFQGHPEYDTISLLKEYQREVARYADKKIKKYPPFPENYFSEAQQKILKDFKKDVKGGKSGLVFPESIQKDTLENTWRDSGRAIISNWFAQVYQVTGFDRHSQFMPDTDPDDPLGLKTPSSIQNSARQAAE